MKIALFFIVFILLFGSTGYYLYIRLTQAFEGAFVSSRWFLVAYTFLMISFILGKFIEQFYMGGLSHILVSIGSITLGFFFYALLSIVFIDLFRMVNHFIPFFPAFVTEHHQQAKFIAGIIATIVVFVIVGKGYLNAFKPHITDIKIEINKPKANFEELSIVALSDIHLGTMVNKAKVQRLIDAVNKINPDVVIIAGDNIDNNIKVVMHDQLLELFKQLKPKYGIYSCMGNHEYISGAHHELGYFEKNGIQMVRDTAILVSNQFYIIGRDDITVKRVTGKARKSITELSKEIDFEYPALLLDHQPFKLNETAEFPVDLQFSGHTHNGQIWPANYITGLLFEQDWGYLKKKNTHFYISAGFGTAGMPIRVGSHSELVHIRMRNERAIK